MKKVWARIGVTALKHKKRVQVIDAEPRHVFPEDILRLKDILSLPMAELKEKYKDDLSFGQSRTVFFLAAMSNKKHPNISVFIICKAPKENTCQPDSKPCQIDNIYCQIETLFSFHGKRLRPGQAQTISRKQLLGAIETGIAEKKNFTVTVKTRFPHQKTILRQKIIFYTGSVNKRSIS